AAETTWLPHLGLAVARAFTAGSADHERLWSALRRAGRLTLRTRLELGSLLRPAVQPGSVLDHTPPPEQVTLTLTSPDPFTVKAGAGPASASSLTGGRHQAQVKASGDGDPLALEVVLVKGEGDAALEAAFTTNEDARPRALPLRRFLLPWAGASSSPGAVV